MSVALVHSLGLKRVGRLVGAGLLMVTMLCAVGCSSSKVSRAPDFGKAALLSGGLALGGVTALGGGEYAPADTVSFRFQEALHERHPDLRYVGLPEVRERIGSARLLALAKRFSEDGAVPKELWAELPKNPGWPTYLAWIDLTKDDPDIRVRESKRVHNRIETDSEGNRRRVVDRVDYVATTRATRSVAAEFSIYERATGRRVWLAKLDDRLENDDERVSGFGFPAPPSVRAPGAFEVLEEILERVVARLSRR
jgi:hypothetical protein